MNNTALKIGYATFDAAKFAVLHWHYSKSMPSGGSVKFGVWENGKFKGVVIYSLGSTPNINRPYGLAKTEVCELTRVALQKHETAVSRIVSITLKMLKKHSPGLKLVVSYADRDRGHEGKIYRAGNWIFEGIFSRESGIMIKGVLKHRRTLNSIHGTSEMKWLREHLDPNARVVKGKGKLKYLMPLDEATRKKVAPMGKPYPDVSE
jgi:hypothetical protein